MSGNKGEGIEPTAVPPGSRSKPALGWHRAGWELAWHDEFEAPSLDLSKWTAEIGGHGWGNEEAQYYTDRPDNAFVEDGRLVICALQESYQGMNFTSARLITKNNFAQSYGRFEARLQLPAGQGIWPAFWLLGDNIDEVGWPQCGEIDIMTNIGSEPGTVHNGLFAPGQAGVATVSQSVDLGGNGRFAEAFHVFAVEWELQAIRWFVDDVLFHSLTPQDFPGTWVYDHPFFILLNVAVGGRWPGYPDTTTRFPQRMLVDYVRVYQRPAGSSGRQQQE